MEEYIKQKTKVETLIGSGGKDMDEHNKDSLALVKMENANLEFYFFSFDEPHIYGGYKNNVHVQGVKITEGEKSTEEDCILSIDRVMYTKMLNEWLDTKINFCDRWGHYCGVGNVLCSAEELYDTVVYEYEEDEDDELIVTEIERTVYQVTSFEIDMEHG
jgi:hypothetical protein